MKYIDEVNKYIEEEEQLKNKSKELLKSQKEINDSIRENLIEQSTCANDPKKLDELKRDQEIYNEIDEVINNDIKQLLVDIQKHDESFINKKMNAINKNNSFIESLFDMAKDCSGIATVIISIIVIFVGYQSFNIDTKENAFQDSRVKELYNKIDSNDIQKIEKNINEIKNQGIQSNFNSGNIIEFQKDSDAYKLNKIILDEQKKENQIKRKYKYSIIVILFLSTFYIVPFFLLILNALIIPNLIKDEKSFLYRIIQKGKFNIILYIVGFTIYYIVAVIICYILFAL